MIWFILSVVFVGLFLLDLKHRNSIIKKKGKKASLQFNLVFLVVELLLVAFFLMKGLQSL